MTEFFEENNGQKSSTRLYSFMMLCFFLIFNFFYVKEDNEITMPFVALDFVILISIFAPKYLHKIMEVRYGVSGTEELDKWGGDPPMRIPGDSDCQCGGGETCICNE